MNTHVVDPTASAGESAEPETLRSDPVAMVTNALTSAGHPSPSAWESRLPAEYASAPSMGHQIFLINRAWRLMVGEIQGQDTSAVRFCLVDTQSVQDWWSSFEQGVLPCILTHALPLTKA